MASFTEWADGQQSISVVESNWFTPFVIDEPDGVLVVDPYTLNYNNGASPWVVTLTTNFINDQGVVTTIPIATYTTGFNFHDAYVPLANSDDAILYDVQDATDPSTGVDILVQAVTDQGEPVGQATTLVTDAVNLLQFRVATVDGGNTYDVAYASVVSGEGTVYSQVFDENGQAVGTPTLIDDYATVSGEGFSYLALSPSDNLAASYLYIRGSGSGSGTGNIQLKYEVIDASSPPSTPALTTIVPDYPAASTSHQLQGFVATILQTSLTSDPYFAVAMRYSYVLDGVTTAAIEVQTIDAKTGVASADVTIPVPTSSAGQTITSLANGGFVLGYGGDEPNNLQAFDSSGNAVGADFVLPADESNFSLGQLPSGQIAVVFPTAETGGNQLNYDLFAETVCFASGTRILTDEGEIAVEALSVGDLVVTASGARRPIRWLGRRRVDCRRHPRPQDVMPIRIAAHAFGTARPARDLYVSPAHAIAVTLVEEVLTPAAALVNGSTIQQVERDEITYWHVELDSHDILLAENLPAESYLDMDNRSFFVESGVVQLAPAPDAVRRSDADYCRPFHYSGPLIEAARLQLSARAQAMGWRLVSDPLADLHLVVDGVRVDAQGRDRSLRFEVPAGACEVWLTSAVACPRHADGASDERMLGVCLAAMSVAGDAASGPRREIDLEHPCLGVGFHQLERDGDAIWRWTSGRAHLPAALWQDQRGGFILHIALAGDAVPRWVAPAFPSAAKAA